MVRDIDATKVPMSALSSEVVAIDDVAIGENVSEGAFRAELAVSLVLVRPHPPGKERRSLLW